MLAVSPSFVGREKAWVGSFMIEWEFNASKRF